MLYSYSPRLLPSTLSTACCCCCCPCCADAAAYARVGYTCSCAAAVTSPPLARLFYIFLSVPPNFKLHTFYDVPGIPLTTTISREYQREEDTKYPDPEARSIPYATKSCPRRGDARGDATGNTRHKKQNEDRRNRLATSHGKQDKFHGKNKTNRTKQNKTQPNHIRSRRTLQYDYDRQVLPMYY